MLGENIDSTVRETLSDPTSWTMTREGLTIKFGQYAIGPYAIDMPEAQIPWSDVKAYLAPDLPTRNIARSSLRP